MLIANDPVALAAYSIPDRLIATAHKRTRYRTLGGCGLRVFGFTHAALEDACKKDSSEVHKLQGQSQEQQLVQTLNPERDFGLFRT